MKKLFGKLAVILCRFAGIAVCNETRCAAKNSNEYYVRENRVLRTEVGLLQSNLEEKEFELSICQESEEGLTKRNEALRALVREWIEVNAADRVDIYKEAYNVLALSHDPDGTKLYRVAQKILNAKEVYHYFPIEDSLGYFEETDRIEDLRWLETHFFGTKTYREINPGVELIDSTSFVEMAGELAEFRGQLYKAIVGELLKEGSPTK